MSSAQTAHGALHYDLVDVPAPWNRTGKPVLFHHGIGSSSLLWRGWFPALIDRYPVAAFDMRGCGRSSRPDEKFKWSMEQVVEDMFAVADAARFRRFHIVGESMGGTVVMAAAIARPERIASVTVSNGAHLGSSIQRVQIWQKWLDEGGEAGWSREFMPDRFHPGAVNPARAAWYEREQARWPRDSILHVARRAGRRRSHAAARVKLKCPVLLLHPDGSPFIPVPVMAELHRLLPTSQLHVFGHSRHGLPFSHARECSAKSRLVGARASTSPRTTRCYAAIKKFEAKTGIKVELSQYAIQDMIPKTVAALDSGTVPDVAYSDTYDVQAAGKWAFEGKLEDLSDILRR
jgi:pimeloyl-ACP methyl ester carboxylesterase